MGRPSTKELQRRRRASLRPHPVRDQIIELLRVHPEPLSPAKMSEILGGTLGALAYHVRTLAQAGVIYVAREGRVRGAVEHFYALSPDDEAAEVSDPIAALLTACGALALPAANDGLPSQTALDDQARDELRAVLKHITPTVRKIAAASTARAAESRPRRARTTRRRG